MSRQVVDPIPSERYLFDAPRQKFHESQTDNCCNVFHGVTWCKMVCTPSGSGLKKNFTRKQMFQVAHWRTP